MWYGLTSHHSLTRNREHDTAGEWIDEGIITQLAIIKEAEVASVRTGVRCRITSRIQGGAGWRGFIACGEKQTWACGGTGEL
jgi:hypothetical protein